MTALALVRHGDLNGSRLSPGGWRQAEEMGRFLAELRPAAVRVLSSDAPRARETASAICSFLGLPEPELDGRLWSGPDGKPGGWEHEPRALATELRAALDGLSGSAAKEGSPGRDGALLVVVTHFEICASLPAALAEVWDLVGRPPSGLARGQGWLVELAARRGRELRV